MRIFSLIFILYLLLLSWQPCQDFAATNAICPFSEKQKIHLHDASPPKETDDCSPFCICSCCKTSTADVRLTFSFSSRFVVSTDEAAESLYQNRYSQNHLDSIWQPPKLDFTV